jgi:hypothetical protein
VPRITQTAFRPLIPDRANYDDKKPNYVQVRAKIERRMFDLGFREERFKDADREIGNTSWNARDQEKVDRYGMWGELDATNAGPVWSART